MCFKYYSYLRHSKFVRLLSSKRNSNRLTPIYMKRETKSFSNDGEICANVPTNTRESVICINTNLPINKHV